MRREHPFCVSPPSSSDTWREVQWTRPLREKPSPGPPVTPRPSSAPTASSAPFPTVTLAPGLFAQTVTSAWETSTLREAHACPPDRNFQAEVRAGPRHSTRSPNPTPRTPGFAGPGVRAPSPPAAPAHWASPRSLRPGKP